MNPASIAGGGRRRFDRSLRLIALMTGVIVVVTALTRLPVWNLLDLRTFDYLSTHDDPAPPENGPIVVAIDEPSFAEINRQWPWPRDIHARLVTALRAAGARAIGIDIIFAEPSSGAADKALAAALGPDVVLAGDESLIITPQAEQLLRTTPLPAFSATGARTGIASITLGGDGVFRHVPDYQDGFAAELGRAAGLPVQVPGRDLLLQAYGPGRSYPTVSYYQALDPKNFLPANYFRDRIVIVGLSLQNAPAIDEGGADAFATPYTVHTGRLVSGAEIQATIFDNLTRGTAIERAAPPATIAAIIAAALAAAIAARRSTRWHSIVIGLAVMLILATLAFFLLRFANLFLSPLGPALAFLAVLLGQAALDYAEERQKRREITRAFSQYLSPALVDQLARDPERLKLGGERRTLSILFCDVRGFTTIAETMKDDPEQLTTLINRLLTPLSDIVMRHGGTIDKYIGDCLMAFWNAPLDDPDHAAHAVTAALEMLEAIDTLNAELRREAAGHAAYVLRIGIGINTGDCVVGNMGSNQRFDYSVLGDAVNLASRLEGASKSYGVPLLLGEATARQASPAVAMFELDRITVKGRTTAAPVFTALRNASPEAIALHAEVVADRYADSLDADDPRLDRLCAAIPPLVPYYDILRSEQSGSGA